MTMVRRVAGVVAIAAAFSLAGCSASVPHNTVSGPASPVATAQGHHDHDGVASVAPAGSGQPGGRLVVHADQQLRPALGVLAGKFEEAFPGTKVLVEYGEGAEHGEHIAHATAVDVLISGDAATTAGVAAREEPAVIARDPLIIATARAATEVGEVADLRRSAVRVAVCAKHTRCGAAARTIPGLRPAMVEKDGITAVTAVVSGTADAALVYRTDVVAAKADLRVVDFREGVAHADQYAVVLLKQGQNPITADAFGALMRSALAQRVLSDAGFSAA
jgi:molybdate transport system substrate-binding protein